MQPQATTAEAGAQSGETFEATKHEVGELASEAKRAAEGATENMFDSVADALEDFADRLRAQDLSSLSGHLRDTAERSPGLFFVGSVATGLALARFMKAGQPDGRAREAHGDADRHPRQTPPPPPKTLRTASSPSTPLTGTTTPRS